MSWRKPGQSKILNFHYFFFFVRKQLFNFFGIFICQLLHFCFCMFFFSSSEKWSSFSFSLIPQCRRSDISDCNFFRFFCKLFNELYNFFSSFFIESQNWNTYNASSLFGFNPKSEARIAFQLIR